MSGPQELTKTIETVVSSLETMKNDELKLEDMMEEFSKAIEAYSQFCEKTSQSSLEVFDIKVDEAGRPVLAKFDWKDM